MTGLVRDKSVEGILGFGGSVQAMTASKIAAADVGGCPYVPSVLALSDGLLLIVYGSLQAKDGLRACEFG